MLFANSSCSLGHIDYNTLLPRMIFCSSVLHFPPHFYSDISMIWGLQPYYPLEMGHTHQKVKLLSTLTSSPSILPIEFDLP